MTYQPVSFRSFGDGLNLRDKEDAVSETEAIDLLNVEFTTRGAVVQRNGWAYLSGALTNAPASLEPFYTGTYTHLLAGCGTRLEALDTAGAVVSSATGLTSAVWDFARFGAPGSEYAYAGNGTDTLRRWSGAAWASPGATMTAGGCLAVMAVDQGNRLVNGGFDTTTGGPSGASTNPSTVWFSDPGLPETWSANNYVHFTPGDGEKIMAIVAWRELLFIFKESKFFVVFGTSVAADGSPVFNYRTVDANVGLASRRAVAVAEDGVYFMDRRGVYRTTGGTPELVSSNVDPIFLGSASSFYNGGVLNHAQITLSAMWAHEKRIYLSFPSNSATANDKILVYEPRFGWWSLYDIPAACGTSFRVSSQAELVFGVTSSKKVARHNSSQTSDNSAAITSRWRSGWFDYDLSFEKTIRESKAWGTGKVSLGVSNDFEIDIGLLSSMDMTDVSTSTWGGTTWGGSTWAAPAGLNPVLRRHAVRGTTFSTYFFNNTLDQAWSVHRLTHHLREERIPSMVNA